MTNTKIDIDTIVDTSLRIIADEWNEHSFCEKRQMLKELLLNPEEFPTAEQVKENEFHSFNDWLHTDVDDATIRYEMKQVLLDVLYDYMGEYAQRQRPDTREMDSNQYDDLMVKFWSDVPHSIKKTVLFGHCLITSLEWGKVVTHIESTTKYGNDDTFTYAMNQIINHHLIVSGKDYSVDKIVSANNPLNRANPERVAQIQKFIDMLNRYVINAYDNDNLNANAYSTDMKPTHIWDAWIDENGIKLYCCDANLEYEACIDIPINNILAITVDSASKDYIVKMSDDRKYNVAFFQGEKQNDQESLLVPFEEFWNAVSNHKNGFCIDVGSQEGKEHPIEVHSAYYRDVQNNPCNWISFSNYNHSAKDEKTGKETLQIEQLGTFEFDTRKILSITDLDEVDRMDRFEIESPKAYHLEFSDGNDVYIGLCLYGE